MLIIIIILKDQVENYVHRFVVLSFNKIILNKVKPIKL